MNLPLWLSSAILAMAHSVAFGQEPVALAKLNVAIELQIVVVPEKLAFPLVRDWGDAKKAGAACRHVQELLAKGTAKLIGWPRVTTKPHERAVVQNVREFRYATQFEPGGVGVYLDAKNGQVEKAPAEVRGVEFAAVPSAFETREVGVTLEVEPFIGEDGKTVTLALVSKHIRLKGMNKVAIERENTRDKMVVEQPEFDSMVVNTTVEVKSGAPTLLGVFTPSEPPEHLELFILTAEVRAVE